jgi:hypothetical protein
MNRRTALMLMQSKTAVPLVGEWLEAFWCVECQETKWYHIHRQESSYPSQAATYRVAIAPPELWQQATGMIHPNGNPSVGEFTRRHARMVGHRGIRDFVFVG